MEENRDIEIHDQRFVDNFAGYEVHLYKIAESP
jgi:hypothetical protein